MEIQTKLALIKGQLVRLNYAKEKIDRLLLFDNKYRREKIDWEKELGWYKENVEYHLDKINKHLKDVETLIIERAKKETESNIKIHL